MRNNESSLFASWLCGTLEGATTFAYTWNSFVIILNSIICAPHDRSILFLTKALFRSKSVFSCKQNVQQFFFLVKVALSWFPRPFWKWSRESFIGSSFDKKVRGANDRVALLWKPHDPNFGWSLRVRPEINSLCLKKEKNAERDWRSKPCPCSWRCSLGQVSSTRQTRSPSHSRATPSRILSC